MGKKEQTLKRIINESIRLLAQNPGASLTQIAESIGIGRATLHRYFPNRQALIDTLALDSIEQTEKAVLPIYKQVEDEMECLIQILRAIIPMGFKYHFLTYEMATMENPEVAKRYQAQLDRLLKLILKIQKKGLISPDIPAIWVTYSIDSLIYTAWVSVEAGDIAPNAAANLVIHTLFQGIST